MSDKNWKSYYGNNPDTSEFDNPSNPKEYDDIMKFSDCTNVIVQNKYVRAGSENCVDAVRGSNYTWNECQFENGAGVSTFTLKGSINIWAIKSSVIGKGKNTDIELGQFDNYWQPGRKPTRNGVIENCIREDGKPIQVTCWDAEPPKVINSNVKIQRVPWIIWFPYFIFRYITIRIKN